MSEHFTPGTGLRSGTALGPDAGRPLAVLFVCLGNICRSPTAQAVLERRLEERGLQERVKVDSCGTGDWHVGKPPDARATLGARRRGYELDHLRARQLAPADFRRFDYILVMDEANLRDVQAQCPAGFRGHLGLLLDFDSSDSRREVPDPYFGGEDGFSRVLDLVERAVDGLLETIVDADPR